MSFTFLLVPAAALVAAICFRSKPLVISAMLLAVAAFCGFGLLASFEPGVSVAWRVGHALVGTSCVIGALAVALQRSSRGKFDKN